MLNNRLTLQAAEIFKLTYSKKACSSWQIVIYGMAVKEITISLYFACFSSIVHLVVSFTSEEEKLGVFQNSFNIKDNR